MDIKSPHSFIHEGLIDFLGASGIEYQAGRFIHKHFVLFNV